MAKSTLREQGGVPATAAQVLTVSLCYDDLLSPPAQSFRLLGAVSSVRIGRVEGDGPAGWRGVAELRLRDPWMSVRHARIDRSGERLILRDDGSANGTFVNGVAAAEHPMQDGDLIELGHTLLVYRELEQRLASAWLPADVEPPRLGPVPTYCPELAILLADLGRIAPSMESVLILGETGAGKEFAAAHIHRLSRRAGPFRAIDCGAVPDGLFESTFFGHLRGAFTGAAHSRMGEIVRAHQGTLFLDEVGNLSLSAQAKLLRVLEDGKVTPVGAAEAERVDVRWLGATNRDLLKDDSFRPDLLRRLGGYVAQLPPLRRRREDLGALTAHVLREAGVERASITAAAGRKLFSGQFAGNVRELRTSLRTASLLAAGAPIELHHLPAAIQTGSAPVKPEGLAGPAETRRRRPEREELDEVLERHNHNITRAAEELGISRRQLHRWLKQ